MKKVFIATLILFLVSLHAQAAPLRVVTTLPDLAEVVLRVGGDEVSVEALLTGKEDVHYVDALPVYIQKVANADIVCMMGLELESSWLPKVLSKSGNAKVQSGGKGYCDASRNIQPIGKPTGPISRSMGDIHPSGNPHYNLSPSALKETATTIANVLKENRPEKAEIFEAGLKKFHSDMDQLRARITELLKPAIELSKKQPVVIEYHQEFSYFFSEYGIRSIGSIEEKPGVPPSAARIAKIASASKKEGVRIAIAANYTPENLLRRFRELSGIEFRQLPTAVHKSAEGTNRIEKLQEEIANAIVNATKEK